METPSRGGALSATMAPFKSVRCSSMTLTTPSSAVNVSNYLQHAGSKHKMSKLTGVMVAMKNMKAMRSHTHAHCCSMTLSPPSAVNVSNYLQHARLTLQVPKLTGVMVVMNNMKAMMSHMLFMTWIHHLKQHQRKRLMILPAHCRLKMLSLGTCKMRHPAPTASTSVIMWLMMMWAVMHPATAAS